jgi:predicted TIM-barrel fold metal-dependent hydrolase
VPQITDWVIDADAHVTEPGDLWTRRVPAKFRDRAPRVERNADGVDIWHVGDHSPMVPLGHTAVAGWKEPFPAAPKNMDEVPAAAWQAKARLAYMDEVGIWAQAIYPNVGGFGNQGFLKLGDPALMLACVQAYNDFLSEWTEAAPERLIAISAIPFWDVDASVAEIERCQAMGHKGILFSGEPQKIGMPLLGDRHWDPLYAAAQEAGLPISFHIGSSDFESGFSADRIATHGIGPTVSYGTVSLLIENGKQLTDLLFSGVLPRFPELKFISVESGIGFIPFILEAADHTFTYSNIRQERPEFELLPSEYFRRQVYGCYFFEEIAPQRLVDKIGADNILFETDYPHPVCLYGNVREKIDAALGGQTDEVRGKLLWDNAARLYRVDPPTSAWAPPAGS